MRRVEGIPTLQGREDVKAEQSERAVSDRG